MWSSPGPTRFTRTKPILTINKRKWLYSGGNLNISERVWHYALYTHESLYRTRTFKSKAWELGECFYFVAICCVGQIKDGAAYYIFNFSYTKLVTTNPYTEVFKISSNAGVLWWFRVCAITVSIPITDHNFCFREAYHKSYYLEHFVEDANLLFRIILVPTLNAYFLRFCFTYYELFAEGEECADFLLSLFYVNFHG